MNTLTKIFLTFLCITGASTIMMNVFEIPFGYDDYWESRGVIFLIFVTLFPRLTLFFSSVTSGGLLWWLAWLISPRFLVAFLATTTYWHSNPILVIISWLVALGGETSEKKVVINKGRPFRYRETVIVENENDQHSTRPATAYNVSDGDTIEAEFEVKKN